MERISTVDELIDMMNKRQNVKAEWAEDDMAAYLEIMQATGSHMMVEGGVSYISLLRGKAGRWSAFHEWLHRYLQLKLGHPSPGEDKIIDDFLMRHQRLLKIKPD